MYHQKTAQGRNEKMVLGNKTLRDERVRSPRIKQNKRRFGVYGARTQHNVGSFVGFFCRHVMDSGNLRGLDCRGGRVVDGAVAIIAVVVVRVEEWAVCYVVTRLATLETGILPLAVIRQGALGVELIPRVSVPSGLIPSVHRGRGLVSRLPGAWPRR